MVESATAFYSFTSLWSHFATTFWPDQLERWLQRGNKDRRFQTVNSVVAAAIRAPKGRSGPLTDQQHHTTMPLEPTSWAEARKGPYRAQWLEAMHWEMQSLIKLGVWRTIERRNADLIPLPLKWVFKYKPDENGYI